MPLSLDSPDSCNTTVVSDQGTVCDQSIFITPKRSSKYIKISSEECTYPQVQYLHSYFSNKIIILKGAIIIEKNEINKK